MLDLLLGIVLLIGLVRGFMKGFIFEIAVLGALFLGLWAGYRFSAFANPYVLKVIDPNPQTLHYISGFVVFTAVAIGVILLAKLFEGLINIAALGIFNKIAGAIFGLLKFSLLLSILLFYFHKLDSRYKWMSPDTKAESQLYYPLLKIAPAMLPGIETVQDKIKKIYS